MKRAVLAAGLVTLFSLTGCIGLMVEMLRPDTDNLVVQKDFQPDPSFGSLHLPSNFQPRVHTAEEIGNIPGVVWLEAMGTSNRAVGIASGFLVEFAGTPHIASAGHLCKGSEYKAIYAHFSEGQKRPEAVEIIACDELLDVCLLRFKDPNFRYEKYPPLGSSVTLKKGARVFTNGSPFGYTFSVSEGIISKLDFGVNEGADQPQIIQHSAKINPGDSGGPLFDEYGFIIGMNVMGFHPGYRRDISTIYGAVPIHDINTMLRRLKTSGHVKHATAGWRLYPTADLNTLDYERKSREVGAEIVEPAMAGLMVWELEKGGPAEQSGLKVGDVLVCILRRHPDGDPLEWTPDHCNDVARFAFFAPPGYKMPVRVYREVRWVEDKLEQDAKGAWQYNHYPHLEKKQLTCTITLKER